MPDVKPILVPLKVIWWIEFPQSEFELIIKHGAPLKAKCRVRSDEETIIAHFYFDGGNVRTTNDWQGRNYQGQPSTIFKVENSLWLREINCQATSFHYLFSLDDLIVDIQAVNGYWKLEGDPQWNLFEFD